MKVRVVSKQYSNAVEKESDIDIAADMAVKVLKSNPLVIGEPVVETSPGCPMGFALPKITLRYDIIDPSIFDKIKMFVTKTSLSKIIKENGVN
jgi:hypothetical protein